MNGHSYSGVGECIYNLLPSKKLPIYVPPKLGKSIYHDQIRNERKQCRERPDCQWGTMGKPDSGADPPENFLKKQSKRHMGPPPKKKFGNCADDNAGMRKIIRENCINRERKPSVPRKHEWIKLPPIDEGEYPKNFINKNAINSIIQAPKPSDPMFVDTRKGDKFPFHPKRTDPGLTKRFMFKDGYGEVPPYIRRRLRAVEETQEAYQKYLSGTCNDRADYFLTPEQREEILDGLKRAWDRYNKEYLCMSLSSDTLKHKARKIYLESEMSGLEKDLRLIIDHKYIFVRAEH